MCFAFIGSTCSQSLSQKQFHYIFSCRIGLKERIDFAFLCSLFIHIIIFQLCSWWKVLENSVLCCVFRLNHVFSVEVRHTSLGLPFTVTIARCSFFMRFHCAWQTKPRAPDCYTWEVIIWSFLSMRVDQMQAHLHEGPRFRKLNVVRTSPTTSQRRSFISRSTPTSLSTVSKKRY